MANCYIDERLRICIRLLYMKNSSPEAMTEAVPDSKAPKPSYVKLAMRNMVKKRATSLQHFAITTVGLLAVLVGLAYLTR